MSLPQKINTACTTALERFPYTFGSNPSRFKILDIRPQLFLTFFRLPATASQS